MKKTTVKFLGRMALEIPDIAIETINAKNGDVFAWYNASLKLVGGLGGLVANHLDKNNIKMLKDEIANIDKTQKKEQVELEQTLWIKHLEEINKIKANIENERAIIQQMFTEENIALFNADISAEIERCKEQTRRGLKEIIDLIDKKLVDLSGEDEIEKNQFLEYKRLILVQYNKTIARSL